MLDLLLQRLVSPQQPNDAGKSCEGADAEHYGQTDGGVLVAAQGVGRLCHPGRLGDVSSDDAGLCRDLKRIVGLATLEVVVAAAVRAIAAGGDFDGIVAGAAILVSRSATRSRKAVTYY